ncbi:unnamed protein product [Didymodactylos carnosus]|uniref:Uncharacterized protein n=1 Tax=Didymodactylos carnosus TaxID=1234261 RepID=A0A815SVK1_9BILA|nr:unnamed protein product [Didymodactylos carnosus]CAF1498036.1 unnamed protein product [Didymodactylos carnosus]CAF4107357.1 unnamed protein product [Didymodactylos carnosus]CAF4360141.1 unnamed protein product [Didymodactylos carnosus]
MALWQRNNYDIRQFGTTVQIPNNCIAKLQYYLDCIMTVIDYTDQDLSRLRAYRCSTTATAYLTPTEIRLLYILCATFSPDEFENKCLFESDRIDSNNEFFELSHTQNNLLVVSSVSVAGRQRQVKKFMLYKEQWMRNNYYQPMLQLTVIMRSTQQNSARPSTATARYNNTSEACTIS